MSDKDSIFAKLNKLKKHVAVELGAPYNTPNDYFDTIEQKIFTKLQTIEEDTLEDVQLPIVAKHSVYSVPANYFEDFEKNLSKKIGESKIIRIALWKKIAAAAIVVIALSTWSVQYFKNSETSLYTTTQAPSPTTIKSVNNSDLIDFAEDDNLSFENMPQKDIDINQLFKNINNQELESFVEESAASKSYIF